MQVSSQFAEQEYPKCPRCDSADTKFCYYNNYNLSQPRHFCRSCKRYWTKGGALRNIPVGGGSRKTAAKRTSPSSSSPAADAKRPAVAASVSACNDSSNKKNNNGGGEMAETLIFGGQFGNFMDACGNFKGEFGNLLDGLVPIDDDDDSSLLISGDGEHFVDLGSGPNVDPRNGLESVSSRDADRFLNIHGGGDVGDGVCVRAGDQQTN